MIEWRKVCLSYPCLACGRPPGLSCVTITGRRKYECHTDRVEQARQNNWNFPDEPGVPDVVGHSRVGNPRKQEW